MSGSRHSKIIVETTVEAPLKKVWACWTKPEHITGWTFASEDWHCPSAENDLRVDGKFSYRMEAVDGSFGFDFAGIYDEIQNLEKISYTLGDGRKVRIVFTHIDGVTKVVETFDAEDSNSLELQKSGWQAILDNFKKYVILCE